MKCIYRDVIGHRSETNQNATQLSLWENTGAQWTLLIHIHVPLLSVSLQVILLWGSKQSRVFWPQGVLISWIRLWADHYGNICQIGKVIIFSSKVCIFVVPPTEHMTYNLKTEWELFQLTLISLSLLQLLAEATSFFPSLSILFLLLYFV